MQKLLTPFLFIIFFGLTHHVCLSQVNDELEIRKLEELEGKSWVTKDSTTLYKLFSPKLVVNSPLNKVATLDVIKMLFRTGKIDISSSEKVIEKVSFIKGMAVVMGRDIVKPQGGMANSGKTVTRQYTDIWIKENNEWQLTIRQATIISIE